MKTRKSVFIACNEIELPNELGVQNSIKMDLVRAIMKAHILSMESDNLMDADDVFTGERILMVKMFDENYKGRLPIPKEQSGGL